ncbi:hypothetical protein LPC08_10250 [Roseomonas sp. OT10]|uniref:hypothetical protein n=1 Tax=Roseomonas cutis TaxID=2897332 RepID=UPI001E5AE3D2|nr:hypothetical protein [Roseomonas sp. OT10]UFN50958.1 hypothetical protein LPC08_10250 [Roseomonas sp. OT10]
MRARLLLPLLLAACSAAPERPPSAAPATAAVTSAMCRIGPGDGPPLRTAAAVPAGSRRPAPAGQGGDRGIGGTGIMAEAAPPQGRAGTVPVTGDRGIGGTGIVGVITGFASICVSGVEVEYDPALGVEAEQGRLGVADLRAGQVVVAEAGGTGTLLQARRLALRQEVSGPVDAVEQDGAVLVVAGQRVTTANARGRATGWRAGEWAAVSGLRAPDGSIAATRLDPRAAGTVRVHGRLEQDAEGLRIGGLRLRPLAGVALPASGPMEPLVTAVGAYRDGALLAASVEPDWLLADLASQFSPDVRRYLVESYVGYVGGRVLWGGGVETLAPALRGGAPGRAVLELRGGPGQALTATALRPVGPAWTGPRGLGPSGSGPNGLGPAGLSGAAAPSPAPRGPASLVPGSSGPGARPGGPAQPSAGIGPRPPPLGVPLGGGQGEKPSVGPQGGPQGNPLGGSTGLPFGGPLGPGLPGSPQGGALNGPPRPQGLRGELAPMPNRGITAGSWSGGLAEGTGAARADAARWPPQRQQGPSGDAWLAEDGGRGSMLAAGPAQGAAPLRPSGR